MYVHTDFILNERTFSAYRLYVFKLIHLVEKSAFKKCYTSAKNGQHFQKDSQR